jgi:DNA (cytosine-5)-methyltransferase 1
LAANGRSLKINHHRLNCVGLFSGIGGIEEGLRRAGIRISALCEIDTCARTVLKQHFPEASLLEDIHAIDELPVGDIVTAGFPCQDLSQAGLTRGIRGQHSGLVEILLGLLEKSALGPTWLLLENVPFMLHLHKGRAIRMIVDRLEQNGWSWAYRTVDARAFGLPQRRNRIFLLASRTKDPRPSLLGEDAGLPGLGNRRTHACGFYWTEGNSGIGWAEDATPPLKGGSAFGIPSPPAVWFPVSRVIGVPSIEDAERLQGFPPGWTEAQANEILSVGQRWRLVGNAVSVPVAEWIGKRIGSDAEYDDSSDSTLPLSTRQWPAAAWGINGKRFLSRASPWPVRAEYNHLAHFLGHNLRSLSGRAAKGFLARLEASTLRVRADFLEHLKEHVRHNAEKRTSRSYRQRANGQNGLPRQRQREGTQVAATS